MAQRPEIVGIQYLRGFCAVAVVVDHVSSMATFPKYYGGTIFGGALAYGYVGVDIFFVISGFIISVVALQGPRLTPALSRSSFFAKRFARIVPLMWLAIAAYVVLRIAGTRTEIVAANYIKAALLIPYGQLEPNNIWTLRHEFVFYLVFALSFLGRRPLRWLIWGWLSASIVVPIATLGPFGDLDDMRPIGIVFSPVNLEFAAGMAVGVLWLRQPRRAPVRSPIDPILLLGLLSVTIMAWVGLSHSNRSVPAIALLALMGGGLVWLAARLECPPGRLSSLGRRLGDASYAIYLFHPHFVSAMLAVGSRIDRHHVAVAIPVIALLAIAIGVLIHLLIERPLVRRVQAWLAPKPAPPPIAMGG